MATTISPLLDALFSRISNAVQALEAPPPGADARAPVWPAGLQQNDVFEPAAQRVEVRQTARTLNQGTEEGVQAPVVLGGTLPAIDQQTPDGNGRYLNGNANCGPTSMAMIARTDPNATLYGVPVSSMTDAQLVMALGMVGGTGTTGTCPNGEIAMAQAMGYQTASALGGFHPGFVDATLAAGGSVIVNGAIPVDGQISGHYMVVSGKDTQGNYVVNDPWTGETLTMTPDALDEFLKANPVNGGWSIAVW
ncbi:MAG TPA: papain-like cysteine protease family protein [Myxococcaceae bacterium]|nr:papain-like cysteine protease family protein [Myxococcaceae bacterium]